jgi:hypothetical protein
MRKTLVVVAASVVMFGWGGHRAMAVCGDGVVDAGEDCDDGGTCIGGPAAGTACHVGDSTCTGGGICKTFGGKGCAANCTSEHDIVFQMVPGTLPQGSQILNPGTSGVSVQPSALPIGVLSLPLANGQEVLTVGKMGADGKIPVVVKAASVNFPPIQVQNLACGCIRGVPAKTCGGTVVEPNGTLSTDCTVGYATGDPCAGKAPCTFVAGEGNTAAGEIGCNGLDNTDVSVEQDASTGGAATIKFSTQGGAGSANISQTLAIYAKLGTCADAGPTFCTTDLPPADSVFSLAQILPLVTGKATAQVDNSSAGTLGPLTAQGAVFNCAALECGDQSSAATAGLAGAFTLTGAPTVGDVAASAQLFAAGTLPDPSSCPTPGPTPPPSGVCSGDCNGDGAVTVNELITLVSINLGNQQPSACAKGIPAGQEDVPITLIIQGVGYSLTQCPAPAA